MLKALSIRLYPNAQQQHILACSFGCSRKVYNIALDKSCAAYKNNKENITSLPSLTKIFFNDMLKDEQLSFLHEENTKIMKGALKNLATAYANFFNGLKKQKKKGFPKFKKKGGKEILNLEKAAFSKKVLDIPNKLFVSKKYGFIRYLTSNENLLLLSKYKDDIRNMTIVKLPSGDYYARLLIDCHESKTCPLTNEAIGLDLGIKSMIVTSEGEVFENMHINRHAEKKMKRLQREVSRKMKGSHNRNKARIRFARLSQYLANCRHDYVNVITNKLINENQVICIEDLNVNGMLKNHHLAKSLEEVSFGDIRRILGYKCEWYGRQLVVIDRYYPSSKRCNECGYINKGLTLSDRGWTCPVCGTVHDRDENAAKNILEEGLRKIGSRTAKFKPVESCPTEEDESQKA